MRAILHIGKDEGSRPVVAISTVEEVEGNRQRVVIRIVAIINEQRSVLSLDYL